MANPTDATINPTVNESVTWVGTAVATGASGEGDCVEGANCDTFTLHVSGTPSDWVGKLVVVKIEWAVGANDYDLYIHKGSNDGPVVNQSGDGAPVTKEEAGFDPSRSGTGDYTVHVVYFAVGTPNADQYHGTATVVSRPTGRPATYVKGGIRFSPNVTAKAPVAARDGEPSSRTDTLGNTYVAGIRGVPAGVDLWYFDLRPGSATYDPNMRNPVYKGQPDTFTEDESVSVGADGGGDVDLAVGMPDPDGGGKNSPPTLAFSSLVLSNVSTAASTDTGTSFTLNPAGSATGGVPVDDRQWQEFLGKDTVYLLYRTFNPAVTQIQRSTDGGVTYGAARTAGTIGQVGGLDVHQASGTVYLSGSQGKVCAGSPTTPLQEPLTYTCTQAATHPLGVSHIFFVVKVADDGTANGTAYVAWSNGEDIFLSHSTDKGANWSEPVRVSDGPETRTSLLPHLETGPTQGSVGVVWYGTTEDTNNDNANWKVFYAVSFNATAASPTFRQAEVSDHFIHGSNISEGGTFGDKNRNLLDYFQVSFDPTGAAVIAYTDDHNDFDGHTFVARQIEGPGIKGTAVPASVEGASLPPPTPPPADGSQVVDFLHDVQTGVLGVVPTDDPLDILSIKYSCEASCNGPLLVATMKVSDLSTVPPDGNWRMNFAANAPFSQVSPTGDYSFGLSDRGDQFFVRATTSAAGAQSFAFGTAVRNADGSLTYTNRGTADSGSFDTANDTITVKVALSKLNARDANGNLLYVTHGPEIGNGSVLAGLRGETFTGGANGKNDLTRGGTQYAISCANALSSKGECFTELGGNGSITINLQNGCSWMAATAATWVHISPPGNGAGSGTVNYTVDANPTCDRRVALITINGMSYVVAQGAHFNDVPTSHAFFTDIGKLSARGITAGCAVCLFCPEDCVSREQMAVFLSRALGVTNPAAPTSQRFHDVPPSRWSFAFVEELARRGISAGCGNGNFCPEQCITREQMAAFVIRALGESNPPTPATQRFADVPLSNPFAPFIERMAQLNITFGCGTNQQGQPIFCPNDSVTRGQMSAFLIRAFGCP